MGTAANKDNKRIAAYSEVSRALVALRRAQDKLTSVAEALEAVREGLRHTRNAERIAQPTTTSEGIVKRDALPGPVRRRLKRLGDQLETLLAEIKAVPVTRD